MKASLMVQPGPLRQPVPPAFAPARGWSAENTPLPFMPKLAVSSPSDPHELEADRIAEAVVAGRSAQLTPAADDPERLHRCGDIPGQECPCHDAPPIIGEVLRSAGQPLDAQTRADMEPRFGHDFSRVRVHTDGASANSALAVNALAYTVGQHMVFAAGHYAPHTASGQRLLAHELTHVVQRETSGSEASTAQPLVQRQDDPFGPDPLDNPRMHPTGAPAATTCGRPAECPRGFCDPYASESYARYRLTKMMPGLLLGIALAVDSRVVPLWRAHLSGGSAPRNLSTAFARDFQASATTTQADRFLSAALSQSIQADPPAIMPGNATTLTLGSRIAPAIAQLGDPASPARMNFDIPGEVPGNIAGDIGLSQISCPAGARPSPFNDAREAAGDARLTVDASGNITVRPRVRYTVKDTIDLCPGNCGTELEQLATVPISQFEATGIAGDVPFTVEYVTTPRPFTINARRLRRGAGTTPP